MRATFILIAVTLAAFVLQIAVPGFTEAFLLDSADLQARPWTLVTSMFLHGDPVHLFYNMFALVIFGLVLEEIVTSRKFWLLYFTGGIAAGAVAAYFYPAALGASGAIFSVLGTLAVLRPRMTVFVMYFPMPMAVAAFVWVAIDLVGFIAPSGVANAAHIAGLLFGVAAGFALRRRYGEAARPRTPRLISEKRLERWEEDWM
jgi:hypothetical protein